ncbi:DNA-binding transcriptional regulator BolA-like [Oscarella lobularis]|uniref:DNA-binding transcriptional regulator BolA-like n=1 Tax=Oscarella lobularis TaxID=121494 RepID=UPI003313A9CB
MPSHLFAFLQKASRLCQLGIANSRKLMSVQAEITRKLTENLAPSHLEVINESYMHNVPKGAESHFKVIVVSEKFTEERLTKPIQRHRLIHDILREELDGSVHALSIQAKSPQQWEASDHHVAKSPPCLGGGGGGKKE